MKTRLIVLIAIATVIALLVGCSDSHESGSNGEGNDIDFVGVPQTCHGEACTEGYVLYENASALQQWSCDDPGTEMTTCYCANPDTQRIGISTEESTAIIDGVMDQFPVTMTIPSLTATTLEVSKIEITTLDTPPSTKTCVPASGATVNYTRTQSSP